MNLTQSGFSFQKRTAANKERRRGGYCPCRLEKTEDNKCICKEFREQMKDPNFEGYCHCMLYYKTKDPIKEEASHAEDHSDQL